MIHVDLKSGYMHYDLKERILSRYPNIFTAPVDELELTIRASNCFETEGIKTVGELVQKTRNELFRISGMGKKSMEEVEGTLKELGLSLNMELKDYPPSDLDVVSPNERIVPITRERLIRAMRIASHRLLTACEVDDPVKSLDYAKLIEQLHRLLKEGKA